MIDTYKKNYMIHFSRGIIDEGLLLMNKKGRINNRAENHYEEGNNETHRISLSCISGSFDDLLRRGPCNSSAQAHGPNEATDGWRKTAHAGPKGEEFFAIFQQRKASATGAFQSSMGSFRHKPA